MNECLILLKSRIDGTHKQRENRNENELTRTYLGHIIIRKEELESLILTRRTQGKKK